MGRQREFVNDLWKHSSQTMLSYNFFWAPNRVFSSFRNITDCIVVHTDVMNVVIEMIDPHSFGCCYMTVWCLSGRNGELHVGNLVANALFCEVHVSPNCMGCSTPRWNKCLLTSNSDTQDVLVEWIARDAQRSELALLR